VIRPPRFTSGFPKFIDIASIITEISRRPPEEIEASFARDLEESMRVRPQEARTMVASKRASFTIQAPNLAYIPPGSFLIEVGVAVVSGFGKHQVRFDNTFSESPYPLYAAFGFFEMRIPIPNIEWRKYDLKLFEIKIPIPGIEWQTIRLPVLAFLINVTKEYMEFFNVAGDSTITYLAIGE